MRFLNLPVVEKMIIYYYYFIIIKKGFLLVWTRLGRNLYCLILFSSLTTPSCARQQRLARDVIASTMMYSTLYSLISLIRIHKDHANKKAEAANLKTIEIRNLCTPKSRETIPFNSDPCRNYCPKKAGLSYYRPLVVVMIPRTTRPILAIQHYLQTKIVKFTINFIYAK